MKNTYQIFVSIQYKRSSTHQIFQRNNLKKRFDLFLNRKWFLCVSKLRSIAIVIFYKCSRKKFQDDTKEGQLTNYNILRHKHLDFQTGCLYPKRILRYNVELKMKSIWHRFINISKNRHIIYIFVRWHFVRYIFVFISCYM